jgi:predicted benzoate:H+ symporter BenE
MYLALALIVLAVLFVVVGIFSGGVFTIVLVPLAVIAVITGMAALMSARAAGITSTLTKQPERQPPGLAPRGEGPAAGEVPATPDDYVEARQRNQ